MHIYALNSYTVPARSFVVGGIEIASREGTVQGDPFAMAAYAVGMIPLFSILANSDNIKRVRMQMT